MRARPAWSSLGPALGFVRFQPGSRAMCSRALRLRAREYGFRTAQNTRRVLRIFRARISERKGDDTMTAHLLVMYPTPKDPEMFERRYREEHLPYAGPRLTGATGLVSKRVAVPEGKAPYYAISDVTFPSIGALQACAASQAGREALAHAASISTGGAP